MLLLHVSLGLQLLQFISSIIVQDTNSTDQRRYNGVSEYFSLLNLCVEKQCTGLYNLSNLL